MVNERGRIYSSKSSSFEQIQVFHLLYIYSIPICKSVFKYEATSAELFLSTSSDLSITKDSNEIILSPEMLMNHETLNRMNTSFPNVTKLSIEVPRQFSIDLWKRLPSVINISQLVQL
jgi:hypothetical protein